MYNMMKKQLFGVEVEFTGISRTMAANAVLEVLGADRYTGPSHGCYKKRVIKDHQGRKWTVMRDASINPERKVGNEPIDEYKVEFVTPPLNYEDIETLQTIVRKFREIGGKSNKSCGIHIHVDGANHDAESLRRMVNFMSSRQDIIFDALGVGDRKNNWCKPISKDLFNAMKNDKNITKESAEKIWYSSANDNYQGGIDHEHYNRTRYHALNLHSYFSKGTVEFRLFNSTLHAGKIKAYIQFCLAVSAWSIESTDNIIFRNVNNYSSGKKVNLMYHILTNRLDLFGTEFKTCRYHMLKLLKDQATLSVAA